MNKTTAEVVKDWKRKNKQPNNQKENNFEPQGNVNFTCKLTVKYYLLGKRMIIA